MPEHETKSCPRCNIKFECKVGDVAHCQCSNIEISIEEKCFIESRYNDCLCAKCLLQLKNRYVLFQEKFLFNSK